MYIYHQSNHSHIKTLACLTAPHVCFIRRCRFPVRRMACHQAVSDPKSPGIYAKVCNPTLDNYRLQQTADRHPVTTALDHDHDHTLNHMVSWCSWLSRQSNTLKVSGSSPGEINVFLSLLAEFGNGFPCFFYFFLLSIRPARHTGISVTDVDPQTSVEQPNLQILLFIYCISPRELRGASGR
ncbi:hypothetical protein F4782DRAFT_217369 [Xylaria castorea]|nr:hypothetical protein F4782DRAFT_217369 [Xylaria castorea]